MVGSINSLCQIFDRTLDKHNYSLANAELSIKF